MNSLLTDSHGFGKLYECELTQLNMWRLSQVVRHGSATPLSPVQIRFAPLKDFCFAEILFCCIFCRIETKFLFNKKRYARIILR